MNRNYVAFSKCCGLVLLAIAIWLICGCGSTEQQAIQYPSFKVYTSGGRFLFEMPQSIQDDFATTEKCLINNFRGTLQNHQKLRITVLSTPFYCGDVISFGCTDHVSSSIFLADIPGISNLHYLVSHEAIHYLTGIGVAGHGSELFTACESRLVKGQ